jgi:FixJ family two-component response regulator
MSETVFIVDDDKAVLRGLSAVLASEGLEVKAFESAKAFLGACNKQTSGCIVLDVRMPDMDGLQAQVELASRGIRMPVIFLTGHGDVPMSVRAMKAGAYDFLQKPVAADTLLARVYGALRLDGQRRQKQSEINAARIRLTRLSSREEEVLSHLMQGNTNKQVAKQLGLSPRTVEIHRKNILAKTEATNLIELSQLYHIADEA